MLLAASGSGGSSFSLLIMMALVIGVAYFLMIRPQRRRQQEAVRMQSSIGPGDEIVTIGGLVGTVESIDDNFVYLQVAPEVVTKYRRQAIAQVLTPAADNDDEDEHDGHLDDDLDTTPQEPAIDGADLPEHRPGADKGDQRQVVDQKD